MPFVEANGLEMYYEDYGEGDPLVVLHGAAADHQVWAEQLQPLTDQYRVLFYDLRGHGKTESPPKESFTMEQYVKDLNAFIDELELDSPIILGHSFGGMIGYRFAVDHPQNLSALVTIGSATPKMFSTGEWFVRRVIPSVLAPISSNEWVMNGVNWLAEQLFGEDANEDTDELERLRERHECDAAGGRDADLSKINRAVQEYLQSEVDPSTLEVELLMMHAENEPYVGRHAEYLDEYKDNCETVEIPDASHNAQGDNPEFVLSRIREFMASRSEAANSTTVN